MDTSSATTATITVGSVQECSRPPGSGPASLSGWRLTSESVVIGSRPFLAEGPQLRCCHSTPEQGYSPPAANRRPGRPGTRGLRLGPAGAELQPRELAAAAPLLGVAEVGRRAVHVAAEQRVRAQLAALVVVVAGR